MSAESVALGRPASRPVDLSSQIAVNCIEAGRLVSRSRHWIYTQIKAGRLKVYYPYEGADPMILVSDLRAFITGGSTSA